MMGIYMSESFMQTVRDEHRRKVAAIIQRNQLLQAGEPRPRRQMLWTWWPLRRQQAFAG